MPKSSQNTYKSGDSFANLAKKKGYRSRSALKLIEINKKDKILIKNIKVLDLGSFPGGWSQVASHEVGKRGSVVSIDKKEMEPIKGSVFFNCTMNNLINSSSLLLKEFNSFGLVLSDLAPNISGIREKDDAEMIVLLSQVFEVVEKYLDKKGNLLVKVFQGDSFEFAKNFMDSEFEKVKIRKPISSRPNSNETYLLALEKKL